MQALLVETVVYEFESRLGSALPQFEPIRDQKIAPVCRLYGWRANEISLFILLQVHRHEDSFTVEIGWSLSGNWPTPFSVFPFAPDEASTMREARFRLGRLWANEVVWWDVAPAWSVTRFLKGPTSRIPKQVDDAVNRLSKNGLPYFDRFAKALSLVDMDCSEKRCDT